MLSAKPPFSSQILALFLCSIPLCGCVANQRDSVPVVHASSNQETIVLIRHGETASGALGQLSCKGLNRAIALPQILPRRFGTPDAIFAPNPSVQITEGNPPAPYSYVRPLATIEPTAIRYGLPVNTQIGYADIATLQKTVTASAYSRSTLFIAWEHGYAHSFAVNMLKAYNQDPAQVPTWHSNDFDMIYIFHITPATSGSSQLTFEADHEGLNDTLSSDCPS